MATLTTLPKTTTRSKKRAGRGFGSGKGGHTSGRGAKGQKARSKVHIWFEGGQLPLIKRLPFQRGKSRFKSLKKEPLIVNLKYLNLLPKGTKVSIETLAKHGIVRLKDAQKSGVKILGDGQIKQALKVSLPTSKAAAKAIKKAGGSVIDLSSKEKLTKPKTAKKPTRAASKKKPVKKPAKKPVKKTAKKSKR